MKYRGVIFDLDGVIVSTDLFHYQAWSKLAEREGIFFNREINHRLRGVSRKESLEIILEQSKKTYSEDEKEEMMTFKNDIYKESLSALSEKDILPGILDFLDYLEEKGIKKAIGSSSKNTRAILNYIGLTFRFDAIVDGTMITNSKPDPEVFTKAGIALNVIPRECLVIEDAVAGIEAAKRAQMSAVAVSDALKCKIADYYVTDLNELKQLF
ncbi:MAG: beta-phosphoglucomutase [Candidatus Izemoplasmatales bacterium]